MDSLNAPAPLSFWQRNRIILKVFLIGFLLLLLLIPTAMISELIHERQTMQEEAVHEVNSRWAGAQTLSGPMVTIPYLVRTKNVKGEELLKNNFHISFHQNLELRL